jgi:hypothetical protein
MKRKLARGSIIIELLVIGTILIGVAATSYLAKRGQEAEKAEALTICEVEGGKCCSSTYSCSGSTSGLSCSSGKKCCFGSCIPPASPTPKPCSGTCIPDGEKDSCKTAGSGTCPSHRYCCAEFKPEATPKPTSPPSSVCANTYAGKCVNSSDICSPSTIYTADCPSGKKCVPETASCSAITQLSCPSGFSVSCSADATNVAINWNDLSGASGYVLRVNKDPYSEWMGTGDLWFEPSGSQKTFSIAPNASYKYDVQGKLPGESYPYAGSRCPFATFSCSALAQLPCPSGFSVSCSADATSVNINWNDLSGASGYVLRVNKDPQDDWMGPGDLGLDTSGSQKTFSITPNITYVYDVQGKLPGESYPYSGKRCPFAAFKCTTQPCSGTCIPDGEKDSCQTQGTGVCSDYRYCCATFKPTPTFTPTPYAGQKCENQYAGRCVSKTKVCSPSTTYSADCPSGKKCVPEAASCVDPTPTPISCQSCGDTAPCASGKSCDSQDNCILKSRNQGDCDCNKNCATGYCYQRSGTDYCCNPGEVYDTTNGCHPPYTATPTIGPCTGTCIPDGEKDTCQTQGTGTCSEYKYCCAVFKPTSTPTPTPYAGQKCENQYAGRCVSTSKVCSPSTTYSADCPSGKKCIPEAAYCYTPTPTNTPTPTPTKVILPCPTGFELECYSEGFVWIGWDSVAGADGYVVKLNRIPFGDWKGTGDIEVHSGMPAIAKRLSLDIDYKYSVQGKLPGEEAPYSGKSCPNETFRCDSTPCYGICLPDGEISQCYYQGYGLCPKGKFCCDYVLTDPTPPPPCRFCGDTVPCPGIYTCNGWNQCVMLEWNEKPCHCDQNCRTGYCYKSPSWQNYCCRKGEIWTQEKGCHVPQCLGMCVPDGEQGSCMASGLGTCPENKYCCQTTIEPTVTPYPGFYCQNNHAGKCVDERLNCSPGDTFPSDCPGGQKCVTETAACAEPTPRPLCACPHACETGVGGCNYGTGTLASGYFSCPMECCDGVCPGDFCKENNWRICTYGCKPDVFGGTCIKREEAGFCSSEVIYKCSQESNPVQTCEPDLEGGHCRDAYYWEEQCILDCVSQGNVAEYCNSICTTIPPHCTPEKIAECGSYDIPSFCREDSLGGHCASLMNIDNANGETCETNYDCWSRRCDYPATHYKFDHKICLPELVCKPGDFYSVDYGDFWCNIPCKNDGLGWDGYRAVCSSYQEIFSRYCVDSTVFYKLINPFESPRGESITKGETCENGCLNGACIAKIGDQCEVGEVRLVDGSCLGMVNCPNILEVFNGNCMVRCNSEGKWETTSGCGSIDFGEGLTNKEKYEILETAAKFPDDILKFFDFNFQRIDKVSGTVWDIIDTVMIDWLESFIDRPMVEYCGALSGYVGLPYRIVAIANCGANPSTYAHELTHATKDNDPMLVSSYAKAVGCTRHFFSSETYSFENEEPVSSYGYTDCEEARAEASAMYQVNPCDMKLDYPIQYRWMKDNLYGGKEFCDDATKGYVPDLNMSSVAYNFSSIRKSKVEEEKVKEGKLVRQVINNFAVINKINASVDDPYSININIGMSYQAVKSELGNSTEEKTVNRVRIVNYSGVDGLEPNVFIFNDSDQLIYFHLNPESLKDTYRSYEEWATKYGEPEAIVKSNLERYAIRALFPNIGFTIVFNIEGKILQYERFSPMSIDEYMDTWGVEIERGSLTRQKDFPKGDANRDRKVDGHDFMVWFNNFGKDTGNGASEGDYDGGGKVDINDFGVWLQNFGK